MQKEAALTRKWSELSPTSRLSIVLAGIVQMGLLVAALWDIRRRPAVEIRGRKAVWYAVAFINYIGPLSYFVLGRQRDPA